VCLVCGNRICHLGSWGVGLATRHCPLDSVPLGSDAHSWVGRHSIVLTQTLTGPLPQKLTTTKHKQVLRSDGSLYSNGKSSAPNQSTSIEEGDIIVRRYFLECGFF
jgi:hypothetical protein